MKKTCLITGVSGFVASHLVSLLIKHKYEVYGIDRQGNNISGVESFKGDILDSRFVDGTLSKTRPDYIFHLAAQSSVKKSWEEPELTHDVNVRGTKNLLEAIRQHVPDSKTLVVSSAEVYGIPKSIPIDEAHELDPVSPYAKSRKEQERLVESFQRGLNITITRSFPHTGPGQPADFVCSSFAHQIASIEKDLIKPVIKVGNLEAERDFLDVRDVAEAYILLAESSHHGVFNVCSGESIKIDSVLKILLEQTTRKIKIEIDPERLRPADIPVLRGKNLLLRKTIDWQPKIKLRQTLLDLLNYWRGQIR